MLEKANTPKVGPAGGPTGRHTKSPVEVQKPDPFAYEGGGLESVSYTHLTLPTTPYV